MGKSVTLEEALKRIETKAYGTAASPVLPAVPGCCRIRPPRRCSRWQGQCHPRTRLPPGWCPCYSGRKAVCSQETSMFFTFTSSAVESSGLSVCRFMNPLCDAALCRSTPIHHTPDSYTKTRTTLFLLCTKSCIVWRKIGVWCSSRWKSIKRKSLKLLGTSRSFRLYFA